jgi:uncharacterized tellurite resistance protein B-like protein
MLSLYVVANSDGEFHQKEIDFFHDTAEVLGYKMKRSAEATLNDIISISKPEMVKVLNQMDNNQKDWYIITLMGMIHADGRTLEIELNHGYAYLEAIGITKEYAESIIKKSSLLMQAYGF